MIALDTNVVSELMRPTPHGHVVRWLDEQVADEVVITAVALAELRYGIATLPNGRRRSRLVAALDSVVGEELRGRVLPFDADAAASYAGIMAARRELGRPMSELDGQIAAICASTGARLATRNVRDFARTGISVVDPWRVR